MSSSKEEPRGPILQTYSKGEAREHISRLVESFQEVEATLGEAQESQIENDYIRPLFRYLNWKTEGAGLHKSEREVVLVETDRQGKRPDYRFQLNGQHLFFMDAKKVKYSMHDPRWQWQVYRYAYSTRHNLVVRKVDFGVLTDFQEFILLDCTFEAKEPEAVNNFRVLDWRYPDYVTQFDRLWEIFERNNVLEASRDRKNGLWACYLTPKQAKANRIAPDEGFLDKLDNDKTGWRVRLAKDMKKCSPDLTGEVITAAVQLLIDRLVFIKALSDRDIDDDYLAKLAECIEADGLNENARGWFIAAKPLFDRLNRFYNGSMFASRPELEAVVTSNHVVREILRELDPNHSPYDLAVLPVEILGTIYERFLGKVVRTTEQRVKIEDKPDVRKAGGVYYTPQYIVRYIVEQTVGKLLADCKAPGDVAKLKILDPACGSGSFLIGAYDALIEWHKSYYTAKGKPAREAAYRDADGDIRLTAKLKRLILLNNIFGVDIDEQAVEVTRLSLSLKALEDTRKDELDEERNLFKETVLPNLSQNIVCGNSLIETDILEGHLFDPEAERKLNPMNYEDKFPEIMGCGGFDAVIGNPPYVPIELMTGDERKYYQNHYQELARKFDTSVVFILRGLALLNEHGLLGFISSITWQTGENYVKLRETLFTKAGVRVLINLPFDVFKDAYVDTGVYIIGRESVREYAICRLPKKTKIESLTGVRFVQVDSSLVRHPDYKLVLEPDAQKLFVRFGENERFTTLGAITKSTQGLAANRFKRCAREPKGEWYPFAEEGQAYRYRIEITEVSAADMRPHPSLKQFYEAEGKILIRRVINRQDRLDAAYFDKQMVFKKDLNPFVPVNSAYHPLFLLGTLNSWLFSYLYVNTSTIATKDDFRQTTLAELRRLPVVVIDFSDPADKARHDKMVRLVEQMMEAKKAWAAAQTEKDKTYYDDKCRALDRQIDTLVCELYGLTAEEIAIVEHER